MYVRRCICGNDLNLSLQKFFQPAINNIRINLGKDSVNEEHIKDVCMQMLEEAKSMYRFSSVSPDSSPYECSDSESGLVTDAKKVSSSLHCEICNTESHF